MPTKLSIEVVRHSDNDIRVVIKDGVSVHRQKFVDLNASYNAIRKGIFSSEVFYDHMYKQLEKHYFGKGV